MIQFIFILLLLTLFSDYFLDASYSQINLPVHDSLSRGLSILFKQYPSLVSEAHSFLSTVFRKPSFRPCEEWIWYYSLATLIRVMKESNEEEQVWLSQWYHQNDYLTQNVILSFINESKLSVSTHFSEQILTCILTNFTTIDFMSEWCCCLAESFSFLSSMSLSSLSVSFSSICSCMSSKPFIILDYLSILLPSQSCPLSTDPILLFLLYLCVFTHHSNLSVRKSVYCCIESIIVSLDWKEDPIVTNCLLLLLDAITKETTLLPTGFHCYLSLISTLTTQSSSYCHSIQQTIHQAVLSRDWISFHSSKSIQPYSPHGDPYWCFYRDTKYRNMDVLFCAYSSLCACCHCYAKMTSQEDALILTLLQDYHVMKNVLQCMGVSLPSSYPKRCIEPEMIQFEVTDK